MKNIKTTTHELTNKLEALKLSRQATTSVCDKSMKTFNVTEIPVGNVTNLTIMTGMDEETSEEYEQAVIETVEGKAYSSSSMSTVGLVNAIIELVNAGGCAITDIGFTFEKITTKNGNNCCACSLI
nr:MAG TPA: hypothetical protein [Caudoviricetes sp.]